MHILQLMRLHAEYLLQSLDGRSTCTRVFSTSTYAHIVYAQPSLDAKVAIIKTLDAMTPLEGYDVH